MFNAMDCDNDFAVNSTGFQMAFNGKAWNAKIKPRWIFTAILNCFYTEGMCCNGMHKII